jgi:hypothetical protein
VCHLSLKTSADGLDVGTGLGDKAPEGRLLWTRLCGSSAFFSSNVIRTKAAHFSLLRDGSDRAGRHRPDGKYSRYGACDE